MAKATGYGARDHFLSMAAYNERVNEELFLALERVTDRVRRRDVGAWFGSLHGTIDHLLICDINWLRRYRALEPDSAVLSDPALDPPGLLWHPGTHETFEELRGTRRAVDGLIRRWFEDFPEDRYAEVFTYRDSKGGSFDVVAAQAFAFLFVHQTHHRGQASQILDTLGVANNFADNVGFLSPGRG